MHSDCLGNTQYCHCCSSSYNDRSQAMCCKRLLTTREEGGIGTHRTMTLHSRNPEELLLDHHDVKWFGKFRNILGCTLFQQTNFPKTGWKSRCLLRNVLNVFGSSSFPKTSAPRKLSQNFSKWWNLLGGEELCRLIQSIMFPCWFWHSLETFSLQMLTPIILKGSSFNTR